MSNVEKVSFNNNVNLIDGLTTVYIITKIISKIRDLLFNNSHFFHFINVSSLFLLSLYVKIMLACIFKLYSIHFFF